MNAFRVILLCTFFILSSTACNLKVGGVPPAPKKYYVLNDAPHIGIRSFARRPFSIMVRQATAPPMIDSCKIIFSDNPSTRGFYRFASWVEPPPKRFTFLLARRMEEADLFASVLRRPMAVPIDLQLCLELCDFYHDISNKPGAVKISVRMTLIDSRRQVMVANKCFSMSGEVDSFDAAGAVRGFDQTVSKILDQVVVWLDEITGSLPAAITDTF
ncbi:MAG: cholesterol transport system auxiliary component [Desulfobacteraceae bacterium Eth-SRB1]|nr:MAG: cholesterol transport system auxiliary component [Desulfobacteraceae bacterium Eth-SRB1]